MFKHLPKHYGWVLLFVTLNTGTIVGIKNSNLQKKITMYTHPSIAKYAQRFARKTGEPLSRYGMPDKGTGRISAHLPGEIKAELAAMDMIYNLESQRWCWIGPVAVYLLNSYLLV